MKVFKWLACAWVLLPWMALAGPVESKVQESGMTPIKSAVLESEFAAALAHVGNPFVGKQTYELCINCHGATGAGLPSGTYPQLAGQHAQVLIKQMADIRKGVRAVPVMYPYAVQLKYAQDLADVAAYLEGLCIPVNHGRYEGVDAVQKNAVGKALYTQRCAQCHGANGEGDKLKFYPVIAGQHYKYLLRQMTEIRDEKRRISSPEMVKVIKTLSDDQLTAISAYQASLTMRGAMCSKRGPVPPDSKE